MKLDEKFFHRDCLETAPELVGKILAHKLEDGSVINANSMNYFCRGDHWSPAGLWLNNCSIFVFCTENHWLSA